MGWVRICILFLTFSYERALGAFVSGSVMRTLPDPVSL
jgi:hypothetical protein